MIAILRQFLAVVLLLASIGSAVNAGVPCAPPSNCTGAAMACNCGELLSAARIAVCLQDCQPQVLVSPVPPAPALAMAPFDVTVKSEGSSGITTAPPVPPPRSS